MTPRERLSRALHVGFCAAVLVYVAGPLALVVPLGIGAGAGIPDPAPAVEGADWAAALLNSLVVGVASTVLATVLGTLAAFGLTRPSLPARAFVAAVVLSPLLTPVVVAAAGFFFVFGWLGLADTHAGLVLAHAALGTPFVVVTVAAAIVGVDPGLLRAAASLGADPRLCFRRVQLPLVAPGIALGALLAFAVSFGDVVVARAVGGMAGGTITRQIWAGDGLGPAALPTAAYMVAVAVLLACAVESLRRRARRTASARTRLPVAEPRRRRR